MKRTLSLSLSVMLMFALLEVRGGNGDKEPVTTDKPAESQNTDTTTNAEQPAQEGNLQDGLYYAEGEFAEDSGWKELVAIKVEGGKIVSANWNGLHKDGGGQKTFSEKGFYGMKEKAALKRNGMSRRPKWRNTSWLSSRLKA